MTSNHNKLLRKKFLGGKSLECDMRAKQVDFLRNFLLRQNVKERVRSVGPSAQTRKIML